MKTVSGVLKRKMNIVTMRSGSNINQTLSRWNRRQGAICLLAFFCSIAFVMASDDILIADFEGDSYGEWKVEGQAFGQRPTTAETAKAYGISGFKGDGLASSWLDRSLKPLGKLTSPAFTIERDYINMRLGGSPFKGAGGVKIIVDGQEVVDRQAVKGHALNDTSISVKAYKGKNASIVIYDGSPGYWGLILVDDIRQSDTKVGFEKVTKEMEITRKLLLFPVANSGSRRPISITVDGILVHRLDACLAMNKEEVAWWGYLDMSDMIGKVASISLEEKIGGSLRAMIECADEPRCLLPKYDEQYRPQFHFSQLQGWNNDPNGMVYYNGRYHLFWQCNPLGTGWGNMYWGHASSPDMVNWTEHKRALRSGGGKGVPLEKRHPAMAVGACFSGSGNVDHNNATGLNVGDTKTLLLFNSDMNAGISAYYSHDGTNFNRWMEKYPLGIPGRDAKVIFHEPTKQWVAISCLENKEFGRHFPILTSPDLKHWTFEQNFKDVHECPEMFELPVLDKDGNPPSPRLRRTKWVLMEASSEYFIGEFNGKQFVPDSSSKQVTMIPRSCYAGQCFSDSPDGRAVYIGWAGIVTENMPFNQGFTIPMNLTLRTVKDGKIHLFANPVKEVDILRRHPELEAANIKLNAGNQRYSKELKEELYDICLTLRKSGNPKTATIKLERMSLTYDFVTEKFGNMAAPLSDGKVTVRILVDRPTMEVFMADGYSYHLHQRKLDSGKKPGALTLSVDAPAGSGVAVEELKAYPMKSIWNKKSYVKQGFQTQ